MQTYKPGSVLSSEALGERG